MDREGKTLEKERTMIVLKTARRIHDQMASDSENSLSLHPVCNLKQ